MEDLPKSALVILVLAFQLCLVSPAPIHINRHVPNASSRPEDLPREDLPREDLPPIEPDLILRSTDLRDLPPLQEPVKILRSTDQDVIIQISRSPGSYLKNETIRLQITNGEVISSKEGSVIWSREDDDIPSEEGSVEVRSAASGQSVEFLLVTLGPDAGDLKPDGLVTEAKKKKKGKKKFSEKEVEQKLNAKVAEKVYKSHAEKGASLFEEIQGEGSVDDNPTSQNEPSGHGNPLPRLQSIVLPKSTAEKSHLNRIRKQKFENNVDGPPKSIRKGLLLKEIEINGQRHNHFGVFNEELHATNKSVHPRRADLRLKDNQLLDNVINSAVSSIANRKPSSLLQRQALRVSPSINQLPQNTPPLLNLGQSKFVPPPLPSPIDTPPSLFNPLRRAERLETTFDGLDRLVDALSRIDYYISNSAKHVLTMLTHHHNTDYRMKRPEPEDDEESDARYFRSATRKQPQHEKLYFLHN